MDTDADLETTVDLNSPPEVRPGVAAVLRDLSLASDGVTAVSHAISAAFDAVASFMAANQLLDEQRQKAQRELDRARDQLLGGLRSVSDEDFIAELRHRLGAVLRFEDRLDILLRGGLSAQNQEEVLSVLARATAFLQAYKFTASESGGTGMSEPNAVAGADGGDGV